MASKESKRPCGAARAGAAGGGGCARPRHAPAKGANWRAEQGAGPGARLGARLEGPTRDGPRRRGLRALPEPGAGPRFGPPSFRPPSRRRRSLSRARPPGGGGLCCRKASTAGPSMHARRTPRGRGPCPGDSGTRRLMAADAGFVGAKASHCGGRRARAYGLSLHVDSSPGAGRGAPLHTGHPHRTGANICNRQNNFDVRVINYSITYMQAELISKCTK